MARFAVPSQVDWMRGHAAGREWLALLPERFEACVAGWELTAGEPYPDSYVSVVWPATRADGTPVALKLQYPEPSSVHEATVLRAWDGQGAIRLLDHDESQLALLLERCVPGTPLSRESPPVALGVFTELIPRLWRPAGGPFTTAEEKARFWVDELPGEWERAGRPCERRLLDAALTALRGLGPSQGEQVLLNQDLHVNNVLRAEREPWLVIDPKPLVGERELAVASPVRDYGLGHGRAQVLGRLDHLTAALGVDPDRARGWSMAYAVVWAFLDVAGQDRHLETARWLLERAG